MVYRPSFKLLLYTFIAPLLVKIKSKALIPLLLNRQSLHIPRLADVDCSPQSGYLKVFQNALLIPPARLVLTTQKVLFNILFRSLTKRTALISTSYSFQLL